MYMWVCMCDKCEGRPKVIDPASSLGHQSRFHSQNHEEEEVEREGAEEKEIS